MSIFDVKGRLVDRIKIEGDMYGKGVYSVDHLVSGIYVLELKTTTRSMKRDVLLLR